MAALRCGQEQCGILLENLYTTVEMKPSLVYVLYTSVGNVFSSIDSYLLFHLLATVVGLLLVLTVFLLMNHFLKSIKWALLGSMMTVLGGGIGGSVAQQLTSADLVITAFTFHSALQRGHEAVGLILYILQMTFTYIYFYSKQRAGNFHLLASIVLIGILQIPFYPYYVLPILLVGTSYYFIFQKNIFWQKFMWWLMGIGATGLVTLGYLVHLRMTGFFELGYSDIVKGKSF